MRRPSPHRSVTPSRICQTSMLVLTFLSLSACHGGGERTTAASTGTDDTLLSAPIISIEVEVDIFGGGSRQYRLELEDGKSHRLYVPHHGDLPRNVFITEAGDGSDLSSLMSAMDLLYPIPDPLGWRCVSPGTASHGRLIDSVAAFLESREDVTSSIDDGAKESQEATRREEFPRGDVLAAIADFYGVDDAEFLYEAVILEWYLWKNGHLATRRREMFLREWGCKFEQRDFLTRLQFGDSSRDYEAEIEWLVEEQKRFAVEWVEFHQRYRAEARAAWEQRKK